MTGLPGRQRTDDATYLDDERQYDEPKEAFKLVARCIKALFRDRGISLIDTACGSGAFLHYAHSQLHLTACVGTDISDAHLAQARARVPSAEFVLDSLTEPQHVFDRQFDVCTCLGTLPLFDDIDPIVRYLLSLVRRGGAVYLFDLVNEHPLDVIMRYRRVSTQGVSEWAPGCNVRCRETFERAVGASCKATITWFDLRDALRHSKNARPVARLDDANGIQGTSGDGRHRTAPEFQGHSDSKGVVRFCPSYRNGEPLTGENPGDEGHQTVDRARGRESPVEARRALSASRRAGMLCVR